ncbi:hypothetical protein CPB86DRAFT_825142 [Serendipita vermifera]|nr:hypothetical protein CPB86DRAFT_825142 [Serendipita vermifera]
MKPPSFISTILVLSCISSLINGLKWPFRVGSVALQAQTSSTKTLDPSTEDLDVSRQEVDAIFRNLDLTEQYASSPDCFLDASGRLNLQCEVLESNQDARIVAAVSMTLCELGMMERVTVPLECRPFATSGVMGGDPMPTNDHSAKPCVEAFHRSPQFWSSYSGYLRQIPQLCFAYRRWHEIDTAKKLYRNATLEKISLLRLLRKRQEHINAHEETFSLSLEELRALNADLKDSAGLLEVQSRHLLAGIHDSWSNVQTDLVKASNHIQASLDEHITTHGQRLSQLVTRTEAEYARAIDALLKEASQSLRSVQNAITALSAETNDLSSITSRARDEWPRLEEGLVTFSSSVNIANRALAHLISQMETQSVAVDNLIGRQQEATAAVSILSASINELSTTTNDRIESINASTLALQRNLRLNSPDGFLEWICRTFFYDLFHSSWAYKVAPSMGIRLLFMLSKFVSIAASYIVSGLASSFVIFFSNGLFNRVIRWSRSCLAQLTYPSSPSQEVARPSSSSRVTFQLPPSPRDHPHAERNQIKETRQRRIMVAGSSGHPRAVSEPPTRSVTSFPLF